MQEEISEELIDREPTDDELREIEANLDIIEAAVCGDDAKKTVGKTRPTSFELFRCEHYDLPLDEVEELYAIQQDLLREIESYPTAEEWLRLREKPLQASLAPMPYEPGTPGINLRAEEYDRAIRAEQKRTETIEALMPAVKKHCLKFKAHCKTFPNPRSDEDRVSSVARFYTDECKCAKNPQEKCPVCKTPAAQGIKECPALHLYKVIQDVCGKKY